jgi:hypothetical protein
VNWSVNPPVHNVLPSVVSECIIANALIESVFGNVQKVAVSELARSDGQVSSISFLT